MPVRQPCIKIHFKDCEVTGSLAKSALSVNDSSASFKIYISGDNKVSAPWEHKYLLDGVWIFRQQREN